jgi:hypothetical protein
MTIERMMEELGDIETKLKERKGVLKNLTNRPRHITEAKLELRFISGQLDMIAWTKRRLRLIRH